MTEVRSCTWHDHRNPISQALRGEVRISGIAAAGGAPDDPGGGGTGIPGYFSATGHQGQHGH